MAIAAEIGCFTLTWEIKNFCVLLSKMESQLNSPDFKTMTSEGSVWRNLCLCYLDRSIKFKQFEKRGNSTLEKFEVSIISSRGEIPVPGKTYTITKKAIIGNKSASLLHDDTLTVCCKMWKTKMEIGEIRIRTVLHRDNFIWNIKNFNPCSTYNDTFIEKDNLLFYMFLEGNADKRTHTFQVEELPNIGGCLSFVYFNPSIHVQRGRITNKSSSSKATKRWEIEIFARNNTSSNFQLHLEAIYAVQKELRDILSSPGCVRKESATEAIIRSSGTLNGDLLHLYRVPLHSDATLRTEGRSFPVHKSILAIRSEVFRAMFEKDQMKEGRSGVVDIDDVDSVTMDRMLVFLYGESLDNIQWEEAPALYYAADKYSVLPLKQKCADILKANLSVANACDVLVLADKHYDQDLMKSAVQFILDHKEVISSPKWEKLEENNCRLASTIMKEILLKKWVK